MLYRSYTCSGLITSDCVLVKRGTHIGARGHVVAIYDDSVDILVKNSDEMFINVSKDDIILKQRMFFRKKDIRSKEDEDDKFIKAFDKLNVSVAGGAKPPVKSVIRDLVNPMNKINLGT
jgi:ribosomal protein L24